MAQGVESMKISSYVSIGTLAQNAPNQPIDIGWAPVHDTTTFVGVGGGWHVSLPVGARQPDAGFRFMEYLTTPAANQLIFDDIGWLGYNKVVAQQLDPKKAPNIRFALEAPAQAQRQQPPVLLPIATDAVGAGVADVIAGKLSAQTMLQQVTRQLQASLDEALKGT